MLLKTATSLAFATACLTAIATLPAHAQMAAPGAPGTEVVTNGPQTNPGDMSPSWSARRNVIESQRYDRLLETNGAFRQARIRKENAANALLRHDWVHRLRTILEAVGVAPPARMLAREAHLQALAAEVRRA